LSGISGSASISQQRRQNSSPSSPSGSCLRVTGFNVPQKNYPPRCANRFCAGHSKATPGPVHLRKAIGIKSFESVKISRFYSHFSECGSAPTKAIFNFVVLPGIDICELLKNSRQMKGITGNDMDHRGFEIPHELNLTFCYFRRRQGWSAPRFFSAPVMEPQTAR